MKNSLYILLAIVLFVSCQEKQKSQIENPIVELDGNDRIPETAFWIEKNKKGNWFNVDWMHNHMNNAIISVFDENGDLIVKAKFIKVCVGESKFIKDLTKEIDFYDGENIQLKEDNCYLMKR